MLIRTYEAAAEYGDRSCSSKARVCRDARKLKLDEKQRASWTPPPTGSSG
jgi:hypothetical protein